MKSLRMLKLNHSGKVINNFAMIQLLSALFTYFAKDYIYFQLYIHYKIRILWYIYEGFWVFIFCR